MKWSSPAARCQPRLVAALLLCALSVGALSCFRAAKTNAAAGPALPSGWPSTLQLGMSDSPGGAAAMKATTSFGFRYQYLSAGVNTGNGWANWNSNGAFATYYIQDSVANNITPVFTYYMIRQSNPGASMGESQGVLANLQNTSTMNAYWNDLKLFFQKAGAFPNNMVVLQVEPDMWGYVQAAASGDNATSVSASVASSGLSELSGLPNNMSGFAKAVVKLRDLYAPNVKLGYHLSYWGTGTDPLYSKPSDSTIDQLAGRSAAFYNSLAANFDVSFAEFSDRDSAFYQYQYGNPNTWWTAADFARNVRYLSDFSSATGKRIVMWQIPLGNTKMLAMNNTWGHYQDNRPEWLLDDGAGARVNLQAYVNAGVVAFLFGGGAGGTTCACDADGDGVTNPPAINGNTGVSLSADDDGGYFRATAKAYYQAGAMTAPGGTTGLLRVTTSPGVPSQVQVNGIPMDDWALNWVKLPPGQYTVSFSDLQGFTTPAPQTVTVTAGQTTTVQGSFIRRGNLRVVTSPPVPSTISVDGVPRNDWGVWTDLPAGSYQVCFGDVAGFNTPSCQTANLTAGQTTVITGTFTVNAAAPGPAAGYGLLRVTTSPAVPGQVLVDGVPMTDWGLDWVKLPPGTYTVSFTNIPNFTSPPPQVVTVTAGQTTSAQGSYVQRGFLRVITSPPVPGTIYVNGLAREDWGLWTSVEPGSYQVCFGAAPGFSNTPTCQTQNVTVNTLATFISVYGP